LAPFAVRWRVASLVSREKVMAAEQKSFARERGPENAGDASALPQPTRHAGMTSCHQSRRQVATASFYGIDCELV
jgi:hypothetical protein